jgi:hypothetical protein
MLYYKGKSTHINYTPAILIWLDGPTKGTKA